MVNLVVISPEEQDEYVVEFLERVFVKEKINNIKGYELRTLKPTSSDITDITSPTIKYYVKNDWTVELRNNRIYIKSEYVCSVIDLNKEQLFAIYPKFDDTKVEL